MNTLKAVAVLKRPQVVTFCSAAAANAARRVPGDLAGPRPLRRGRRAGGPEDIENVFSPGPGPGPAPIAVTP